MFEGGVAIEVKSGVRVYECAKGTYGSMVILKTDSFFEVVSGRSKRAFDQLSQRNCSQGIIGVLLTNIQEVSVERVNTVVVRRRQVSIAYRCC